MMLRLVRDVFLHLWPRRRTHGECAVSFLPRERRLLDLLMNPYGGGFLQLPHEVGEAMRGLQSHQQMHMIGDPADALNVSSKTSDRPSEVFVQPIPPGGLDQRVSLFCGKDDVVMQGEERRRHNDAGLLASLRDARVRRILSGGIATLNQMPSASGGFATLDHRLIAQIPSGSKAKTSEPEGFIAISRWLRSVATTPPVCPTKRWASRRDARMLRWLHRPSGAGWLASRWDAVVSRMHPGGVAPLNHRLMAWMPSASST